MVQALPFIVLAGVFYIAIASVVAFLIGALVGAAFALLDILVLLTCERLLTLRNSEAAIRSSDDDHGRIPHHTYDAERN